MANTGLKHARAVLMALGLSALSVAAHADFIGLYAGVDGIYNHTSMNDNQAGDDKFNAVYNLAFEHPVPFLPNVKLRYSDFSNTRNDYQSGIYFVDQDLEVNTLDAIAYYEILDNIISVDAGLGIKRLDVTNTLRSTVPAVNITLTNDDKQTLPALYLSAGGKLPFTGFSAKAEVMAGQNSDADFSDMNAEVKYNFIQNIALDLGVKFGYRAMTINFDDSNSSFDKIEAKGPYVGLEAHF